MIKAAKLVMIDPDDNYFMMYRADHPAFGDDPDLPGGTHHAGEELHETVRREAHEETGVVFHQDDIYEVYSGTDYTSHGCHYALFVARVAQRPDINLSWEHSSYEWLDRQTFLYKAKHANDTFMHMAYDVLKSSH